MFFPNDTTTEIVAHFMGYFDLAVEAGRQRQDYTQIRDVHLAEQVIPDLEPVSTEFVQKYTLSAYQPGVDYIPPTWLIRGDAPIETFPQYLFFPPRFPDLPDAHGARHDMPAAGGHGARTIAPEPGSVMAAMMQTIGLTDNDVLILADYNGPLFFASGADLGLAILHAEAMKVMEPLAGIGPIGTVHAVPLIIEEVVRAASDIAETGASERMSVIPTALNGTYVNGVALEEAPRLVDVLPALWHKAIGFDAEPEPIEAPEPEQGVSLLGDDVDDALTLKAGGNLLVNNASHLEAGLTATVLAVAGDVHQLDAIIQTNAYWDFDQVIDQFTGEATVGLSDTSVYNIASFIAETRNLGGEAAAANPGTFPYSWNVTVFNGDLVSVEWLKQLTFMSDQDITILSATGASTFLTTGENGAVNAIDFANLGMYYDLVVVGGNLYDANLISQTNILYDNDVVDMLAHSMPEASKTSGNLLWNEASIHNIGPTQFTQGMPDHYAEAIAKFADGDTAMPAGFSSGKDFEGFGALKVLYVSGSLYDLRYIEQKNILGDADFVAVQKANALAGAFGKNWDVDTGSNSLANIAQIKDFDTLGNKAYAGGNIYSDAILIQADLLGSGNPVHGQGLVSEIVAFLDVDKAIDVWSPDGFGPALPSADGPAADILQSMLA